MEGTVRTVSQEAPMASSAIASAPKRQAHKRGDGEGSIDEFKPGLWRGRLMVGYAVDGKPDRRAVYGKTRAEVQRKVAELRRRASTGMLGDATAERQTVAAFLTRWLSTARGSLRPRTWQRYDEVTRLHLSPALGRHKLSALRPSDVQRLYADKLAAGLSPLTVRYLHAVLHRALNQAVRWADVPRNVADAVDPPAMAHTERRPPTASEVARLLDTAHAAGDDLATLWMVAVYTGCRLGELLGLTWPDIDLEAGTLTVRRALLAAAGGIPQFGDTKTQRSRRTISLPGEAVQALREHRQAQLGDRLRLGPEYAAYDLVFATRLGTPFLRRNILRSFKAALRRASLSEQVRVHDLRHAAATILRSAHVDLKTVSERLGHSSIRVTADVYQHAVSALDADAAMSVQRAIRGAG